jgi:hypothetical protein
MVGVMFDVLAAGEITREHDAPIAARYTPERAPMIEHIEAELVAFARLSTPAELRAAVKTMTDAYDGDTGAKFDAAEHEQNTRTSARHGSPDHGPIKSHVHR